MNGIQQQHLLTAAPSLLKDRNGREDDSRFRLCLSTRC